MILVDTSVWMDFPRGSVGLEIAEAPRRRCRMAILAVSWAENPRSRAESPTYIRSATPGPTEIRNDGARTVAEESSSGVAQLATGGEWHSAAERPSPSASWRIGNPPYDGRPVPQRTPFTLPRNLVILGQHSAVSLHGTGVARTATSDPDHQSRQP